MRLSAPNTLQRIAHALNAQPEAKLNIALAKRLRSWKATDWSPSLQAQLPVAVGSRALTPHEPDQQSNQTAHTPHKARSAPPSRRLGAAAAEYGSCHRLTRASSRSTASPWSSGRLQRGAGSAVRGLGTQPFAGLPSARPNPSLKLTRYGRLCKPGLRYSVDFLSPGLQSLPTRAA